MKTLVISAAVLAVCLFSVATSIQAATPKTNGIYLTAADYKNSRLSFEGDCGSKTHKLDLHDIFHKPYIDVIHESEKRRYPKSDLFGYRACVGGDYRFGANLEYQILEAREFYIYARKILVGFGKSIHTAEEYYFSAGPKGKILALTLENLKQAVPDNYKFHDSLDGEFGVGHELFEYDEFHKMFKVNWLLISCREH